MRIERIGVDDREEALALVWEVFMQFEAPDYSEQGIATFKRFLEDKSSIDALEMYGAYDQNRLVGVIATRNNGNHIALLFVDGSHHRRGIGRRLFERVVEAGTGDRITVNSSPYAVEVYKHLGFAAESKDQLTDGIRYVPMTYVKET